MKDNLGASPKRIQRKRTKGWKMPPNTVYVGRPTKWGNPYIITDWQPRERCIERLREHYVDPLLQRVIYPNREMAIRELRGKDLACWCPLNQPCHADVLLEIAND